MNKPSIFLFACIISVNLAAQQKIVLADDFSSYKNEWDVGKIKNLSAKIEDGKFIIDNNLQTAFHPQLLAGVDSSKAFEISASVRSVTDDDLSLLSFSGLIFGSNMYRKFCFAINANGEYALFEMYNNDYKIIIAETKTPHLRIEKNATNRLKLNKAGKQWKLYINDSLVNSVPSQNFYGPYIGFYIEQMKAEFDDLKVTGTPVVTSGNLCALFPLIFQSAKNNFEYIKGEPVAKGDTVQYYLSTILKGDSYAKVRFEKNSNDFFALLNSNTIKAAAIKYTDSLILQMKKCLPGYTFTKTINKEGLPEWLITEKIKSTVKQPEAYIKTIAASGFSTIVRIYADPVKSNVWIPSPVSRTEPVTKKKGPGPGWIFLEEFADNKNRWTIDTVSQVMQMKIRDNKYFVANKTDKIRVITRNFETLNEKNTYRIEMSIAHTGDDAKIANGIIFGSNKDFTSYFRFIITRDGYYRVDRSIVGLANPYMKDWTQSHLIKKFGEGPNKLVVMHSKGKWVFSINDVKVFEDSAKAFWGKNIGFLVGPKSDFYCTSFKIYDWTKAAADPDAPKEFLKETVFTDDFKSNKNNWYLIDDKDVTASFRDNAYRIKVKYDGFYMPDQTLSVTGSDNHRFDITLRRDGGIDESGFGLCFGKKDVDNAFVFLIKSGGYFQIGKYFNGNWYGIKDLTESDAINKENRKINKLSFENSAGKWNFYINDALVYSCASRVFPGNKFGCYVEKWQTIEFLRMEINKISIPY